MLKTNLNFRIRESKVNRPLFDQSTDYTDFRRLLASFIYPEHPVYPKMDSILLKHPFHTYDHQGQYGSQPEPVQFHPKLSYQNLITEKKDDNLGCH